LPELQFDRDPDVRRSDDISQPANLNYRRVYLLS